MREREYYAVRKGFIKKDKALSFEMFKKAFRLFYRKFDNEGYFQKYLGINCTDGFVEGVIGDDIQTAIFLKTGNLNLWSVYDKIERYNEVDLYTMIEFLYDCASRPVETSHHSWNDCGIHVTKSDDKLGKIDFRNSINPILLKYQKIELSEDGEILQATEDGFEPMFNAPIPTDDESIKTRITSAIFKFRRAASTVDDRKTH